jgi:hypothetical protein
MENTRQKLGRSSAGSRGLLAQLRAGKKKPLFAVALLVIMAVMWLRVFGDKGPETADARQPAETEPANGKIEIEIAYVDLPKIPGRNDCISRDFFALDSSLGNRTEVEMVQGDDTNSIVRTLTKQIWLEAIDLGEKKAFINDRLYGVGDRMLIKDGSDEYDCEIVSIEENTVLIRCQQTEIKVKLAQGGEVVD